MWNYLFRYEFNTKSNNWKTSLRTCQIKWINCNFDELSKYISRRIHDMLMLLRRLKYPNISDSERMFPTIEMSSVVPFLQAFTVYGTLAGSRKESGRIRDFPHAQGTLRDSTSRSCIPPAIRPGTCKRPLLRYFATIPYVYCGIQSLWRKGDPCMFAQSKLLYGPSKS